MRTDMKTLEERYMHHLRGMQQVCREGNWGDPFSYARAKEIAMAIALAHTISPSLPGADAFNQKGEPVEYKSTIGPRIQGVYNGISVFPTWEEQEDYLLNKKIGCYPEHYIARFDRETNEIVEIWVLTGKQVCDILIPKLKEKFSTILENKDPRLGATLTQTDIYKYGKRIK